MVRGFQSGTKILRNCAPQLIVLGMSKLFKIRVEKEGQENATVSSATYNLVSSFNCSTHHFELRMIFRQRTLVLTGLNADFNFI